MVTVAVAVAVAEADRANYFALKVKSPLMPTFTQGFLIISFDCGNYYTLISAAIFYMLGLSKVT